MTRAARAMLWTAAEAAAATGGRTDGEWWAGGVSIDSRTIESGDLFVALQGPTFDGHDYVVDAFDQGAAAAVVHRPVTGLGDATRMLAVADTMAALQGLATYARKRTAARIAAVTGSVGKTGTKEFLRLCLEPQGRVSASHGNLNNQWGLPLSLARMPAETDFGVFELGMNRPGEIEPLSRLSRPHAALVTTVEPAHTEFFESLDRIADAKAEIFTGVEAGGTAILNLDNTYFERLEAAARRAGIENVLSFGVDDAAWARLVAVQLDGDGSRIEAEIGGRRIEFRIGVPGRHWVINALGMLATVEALGADCERAAAELAHVRGLAGRGAQQEIAIAGDSFVLIDESYNASPASMAAAVAVLGHARPRKGGRRIAVLGDMLELGAQSEALHAGLVDPLIDARVDLAFTAGQYMAALWERLPAAMRGGHASTAQKLVPLVQAAVQPGDIVMIKGSLGSRTSLIVDALFELEHAAANAPPRAVNGE